MQVTRCWLPEAERLEDRTVPGAAHGPFRAALHPPPLAGAVSAPTAGAGQSVQSLSGEVSGTWRRVFTNPDVGGHQTLGGTGTVVPLGSVSMTGDLFTPGFVAHGRTRGNVTLAAAGGTLTVHLVGPRQKGFSQPPSQFHFTVTGGTGAFLGASGKGTVGFQEQMNPPLMCPPNALCLPLPGGTFTMTFRPGK